MLSLSYTLTDQSTPALRARIAALSPQRLATAAGRAVMGLFRDHFIGLGVNQHDWPTTRFWPRAAEATSFQPSENGVAITVNQTGVRQRLLGGPINPKNAKVLTIPLCAEAYGHRAADFPGAFLLKTRNGTFLVQHNAGQSKNADLTFLFALFGQVHQQPNPNVLPSNDEITNTALRAMAETANQS